MRFSEWLMAAILVAIVAVCFYEAINAVLLWAGVV